MFEMLPLAGVTFLGANLFTAIQGSDIVGQACLVVTGIFSIISWAVVVYKWLHLKRV